MKHMTRKASLQVNQNEGLIFEKSSAGKAAWKLPPLDVPEVDTAKLLGASERKDLGNMPEVSEIEIIRHFTRHVDLELRHRSRHVSAGLVHHEVQPAGERGGGAGRGNRKRASLPAGEDFAGRAAHHQDAERATDRNHRHGRDHAAARRRRAWRDDRPADGSRLSPVEGQCAQENSDSRLRARNQSGDGRDGELCGRESEVGLARHGRHRGARSADERRCRRAHADQSQHAGRVRAGHPQDRRHPARQGRPALHGRRQHERAGRQGAARRFRRRRHAPEPAQDVLDAARRRRSGFGPGGDQESARAVSCRRRW